MISVLWLGILLGVGAAFSVGPIFVMIVHEAATRGMRAAFRVILGSATADLLLLIPAIACAWVIQALAHASFWVGLVGSAVFLYLSVCAMRDARRMWRARSEQMRAEGWAFWKGVAGNLSNPLSWTFWLATGTPTILRTDQLMGVAGVVLFTATWFVVASGLEAVIACIISRSRSLVGTRGHVVFTGISALMFLALASNLMITDVLPRVA